MAGGLNGTAVNTNATATTGGAAGWVGYVGQVSFTGSTSKILTRAAQTGPDNRNQDLVTSGSSSQSYGNPAPATVGSSSTSPSVTLAAGSQYTESLIISLASPGVLSITNVLYAGGNTNGSVLSVMGGQASGSTYLTNSFDALAFGWRVTGNTYPTTMDVNSITVISKVTGVKAWMKL